MTVIPFPKRSVPDDPFYKLEEDDREPEPIHFGEDELLPEEFDEVLDEQDQHLNMDRLMADLAAMGFTICVMRLD